MSVDLRTGKKTLTEMIGEKYSANKDNCFLKIATHHVGILEKYLRPFQTRGAAAFPSRKEYQAFAIAKLFVDKVLISEFHPEMPPVKVPDPDFHVPSLEAFHMTEDEKEMKRNIFLKSVARKDLLHLRVLTESSDNYTLEVINKYNDKERIIDYKVFASMVKSAHLAKACLVFKEGEYLRAVVHGSVKQEELIYKKILVSLDASILDPENQSIFLGRISIRDIRYFPEDISGFKSLAAYLKSKKEAGNPEYLGDLMASMGLNPYNTQSFCDNSEKIDQASDYELKKLKPKKPSKKKAEKQRREMEAVKSAVKLHENTKKFVANRDLQNALSSVSKSLAVFPLNSSALTLRGEILTSTAEGEISVEALKDFKKATALDPHNEVAIKDSMTLIRAYISKYKDKEVCNEFIHLQNEI